MVTAGEQAMGNPISQEIFLARASLRFGDAYDYSSLHYRSFKSPIKIRCKKHPVKEITITPEKHLQTTGGCKYCLKEMRITSLERELCRAAVEHPTVAPLPSESASQAPPLPASV
jgi:hypothetical protein